MSTSSSQGGSLPKFGEWDVNNPASAEGFSVIFARARDDKNSKPSTTTQPPHPNTADRHDTFGSPEKKSWLCCF